ncbi:A-agglutinin anchorage subunit [Sinocyclocheilus anshuiensis]|uniref:A-agglutinin anchorage subunit n=1 Tax=Sinocyclocheilus anshuiensis TaxID=1608454 RepID=UPI0007BA2A03|nr:PREDICTED: A-agglutinin anchorage subunit-like [Sinocyclocheilus anshuiensis]
MGWKRVHHLVIILIFLKHAVGHEGSFSQNAHLQENWRVHKRSSPRVIQSSVLEAPVTGSSPVEEVAPNMVIGKSLNASRSRFSLSRQYVKGGFSSSYEPMSRKQSAPSVSDSISSVLKLQGSSSPNTQNEVSQSADRQGSYSWSSLFSLDGSGPQGVSAQLASTPVRGGSSSGLSILSPSSSSQSTPDSLSKLSFSPFDVSGLPASNQSPSNMFTASSQSSSGLQLGGTSSLLSKPSSSSSRSSGSSRRVFTVTYQGSAGPQLAGGSSQLVSTSGLLTQPPSAESQNTSGSSYVKLAASPLGFSQVTSGPSSSRQYTLSSQSRVGTELAASHQYVPGPGSSYGLSVQPQGTASQYASAFSLGAKLPMSSQYYQATRSGSLSPSQSSLGWQPSVTRTQGFQASSTAVSQGSGTSQSSSWFPSRLSSLSSAGGYISSSVQSQGTSSQNAPVPLGANVPVYSQAAPSGSSLFMSQPSQLHPPASRSQSFQTSGTVALQSGSLSQSIKTPSRFSISAVSPGQLASTQGSGRYDGLFGLSQSASTRYSPGSPVYAKRGSSLLDVSSQSSSGPGSYRKYTSSSQSRAGTQLAGSSPYVPVQTGSTSTDDSNLRLQGTSSQYTPLNAKVYSQAAASGPLSPSQPSQWQTSSKWLQGFQTSGTVALQSGSPSQGSKAPSKFSTLTSAASPGQFVSTQEGNGRYSGLSSLSPSTSSLYSPGSPVYAKRGSSVLDVSSQSSSGPISYRKYTSSSQSRAGTQLAGSSPYVPVQTGSTSTDDSNLRLQGTSSQYTPLNAKVYSQAAASGPLSPSQPSQWQTSSKWLQGFQTSGTVALQSGSPSQGSKAPSKFSTLTSAASPGQFVSTQEGSGRYSGLSSLSQSTSSQYSSGSPAYAKRGSSLDFSSQSISDPSSSGLYASSSQSMAGTQLAGSSSYVPAQTGTTFTGASFQVQGTSNQYAPSVSSQYTRASPSESSVGSEAYRKRQPSASTLSQWFQASGTAVPQSSSFPQSSQTSSGSSFLPALSPSVAQSSVSSSRRTLSFFGTGLGPSKLSAQAASGSTISQISPGLSASVNQPPNSMTSSLGSSVQGALQGIFSGQSSDSTSLISSSYGSTYDQKATGFFRPSQSSSATGRYSSVKG